MNSKEILPEIISYTPAPWYVIEYAGYHVLQNKDEYDDEGDLLNEDYFIEAENNALLASKAPELLNALLTAEEEVKDKKEQLYNLTEMYNEMSLSRSVEISIFKKELEERRLIIERLHNENQQLIEENIQLKADIKRLDQ